MKKLGNRVYLLGLSLIHIYSMVNDLKIYRYVNSQIFNMVRTEIQPFFSDKASAENVARIIQEKVRMYLNEQA